MVGAEGLGGVKGELSDEATELIVCKRNTIEILPRCQIAVSCACVAKRLLTDVVILTAVVDSALANAARVV